MMRVRFLKIKYLEVLTYFRIFNDYPMEATSRRESLKAENLAWQELL